MKLPGRVKLPLEFRAAVLHELGGRLSIEDVALRELGRNDVVVRVAASGLCHTDLEVILGSYANPLPAVLGHEGAGTVEAVGDDVTAVAPGDHVVCSWGPSCGRCFFCERDDPILCEQLARGQAAGGLLDGGTRLSLDGRPLHHQMLVSSHAEYCVVPETGAIPVPRELPFDRGCLIGCGVMTGFGAAVNVARVEVGSSVAVVGCGVVGLNVVQGARLRRAGTIVAVEPDAARREKALAFGATHAVDPRDDDAAEYVRSLTAGRGTDYAFEAAGNEAAMRLALECARRGAHVVILGKVNFGHDVSFRFGSLVGEKRIVRSSYGGARPRRDFPLLARLYLDGDLLLDELITDRITLDEINDGFDRVRGGDTLRTVTVL